MSQVISQAVSGQSENQVGIEKEERYFIEEDVFQKLLELRDSVYQATDVGISIRKLVNMLLRQVNFLVLYDELVQKYG